jgi:hypothetical protein
MASGSWPAPLLVVGWEGVRAVEESVAFELFEAEGFRVTTVVLT